MSEPSDAATNADSLKFETMNFGMVLDRAIHLYSKNFALLIGIMVIPEALGYLNSFISTRITQRYQAGGMFLYLPVSLLVSLLLFGISAGAVTVALSNRYLGKEISILQAYRAAFRRLGTLLGAWIVAWLLIMVGFFVIVPGIMLAISFCLITPVIMLESQTAKESRKRSRELVKGFRWQTLGLFVIYFLIQSTLHYATNYLVNLLTGSGQSVFLSNSYLHQLAGAPIQILLAPFPAILTVLIYYNQRIRKEGFDLLLLAEALAEE